jgi:RsiW-degrading membrane proteinase PrsW (M82 family)
MKNLNIKHAAISSIVVYILGILAYVGSFFIPIMDNPELQANLVLGIAIIPAAYLGAHIYYQKCHSTNGFVLGIAMFFGAIILDAIITIPIFIIPNGGSHFSFFGDPGFWLIGLEYILFVMAYWRFNVMNTTEVATA